MHSQDQCNFSDEDIDQQIIIYPTTSMATQSDVSQTPKFHSDIKPYNHEHPIQQHTKRPSNKLLASSEKFIINKQIRLEQLKQEQQRNIMEKCTFKPNVNKNKSPRNLKQFLESQNEHLVKVSKKKVSIKQKLEEKDKRQMTFSPIINKNKKQEKNKLKEAVHERLYKLKDKNKEMQIYQYQHIPRITQKSARLTRNKPIQDLLYEDAIRRAKKYSQLAQQQQVVKVKDVNKEKYAAQKLLKDFEAAIIKLQLVDHSELTYAEFNSILLQLGYAHYSVQIIHSLALEEKRLINQAYNILLKCKLTAINVCIFLLALAGIYNINFINSDCHKADILTISSIEGKRLHCHFDLLYRNKLCSDTAYKQTQSAYDGSTFKPHINPDHNNLAGKYRFKMIEQVNDIFAKNKINISITNKELSHGDLLVIHNISKHLQKQKMRENKLAQTDPQCTFQPNSFKKLSYTKKSNLGKQKCQELYEYAKIKNTSDVNKSSLENNCRQNKENENMQKVKQKYKIMQKKIKNEQIGLAEKTNMNSLREIKDIDKSLARIYLGRQMRNQKTEFLQRGEINLNKTVNISKSFKLLPQDKNIKKIPIFVVDISMDNTEKQIYFYKGDQNRIQTIINDFCHQYKLDKQTSKYLEQKLKESIQFALKEKKLYN